MSYLFELHIDPTVPTTWTIISSSDQIMTLTILHFGFTSDNCDTFWGVSYMQYEGIFRTIERFCPLMRTKQTIESTKNKIRIELITKDKNPAIYTTVDGFLAEYSLVGYKHSDRGKELHHSQITFLLAVYGNSDIC